MASGEKYSEEILRSLKESLADLETMKLLSREEIQSIDRIRNIFERQSQRSRAD